MHIYYVKFNDPGDREDLYPVERAFVSRDAAIEAGAAIVEEYDDDFFEKPARRDFPPDVRPTWTSKPMLGSPQFSFTVETAELIQD